MSPLLDVRNLTVEYVGRDRSVKAVDNVSFTVDPGEIVGICGESGCGKSTTAHAILRILHPPAEITGGQVLFQGQDLVPMRQDEMRQFRWRHVSLVFQSAMNALNPVMDVGDQFTDMIRAHEEVSRSAARGRAGDLLQLVGINRVRVDAYPHELSGGMRQRVVIAMALALRPELIVMDEPTTALDVVVQRQILQEIQDLQQELGFAMLFITHDLSLLVEFSNRIAVMYAGEIVEMTDASTLFHAPKHPYSVGLMNSFPPLTGERRIVQGIPGAPPDLGNPPAGCRFHPRCPQCTVENPALYRLQTTVSPVLREVERHHLVACHLYDGDQHDG